jgi:mucin-19
MRVRLASPNHCPLLRTEVSKCGHCLAVDGCGYCLSTLRCMDGNTLGPLDGSPCPTWIHQDVSCPGELCVQSSGCRLCRSQKLETGAFPTTEVPQCEEYTHCSTCVEVEDCAWCASENQCMTVSDIFGHDCRGTVFDPPCPTSFVGGEYCIGV